MFLLVPVFQDLDKTLAMAGTFVGTVTYMSPERCLGACGCGGGGAVLIQISWDVLRCWILMSSPTIWSWGWE